MTLDVSFRRAPLSDADRAAALASPLLQGLDRTGLEPMLQRCAAIDVPAGTMLLAPGDRNSSLFLVSTGRLLVFLEDPGGKHYLALESGECVGEMSLIDGRSASAHVVASANSRVIEIGATEVWRLVDSATQFARNLLRVLAGRLRNDNTHLQRSLHLQREYEQAAKTDLLTGMYNRRWMEETFPRQIARSRRSSQPLALLMADIDHFKRLNDRHGHTTGDQVLKAVAQKLSETLRPTDLNVRYGGEEFVALLPGAGADSATAAAERLRRAIEQADYSAIDPAARLKVTVSIGVAVLRNGDALEHLIERADAALYRAKAAGRNRVVCQPQ
ncbi:MAG TPA: GGDEF domain-containing protein [Burkholderiales bacterium]|nr:GGDEF domain-containing protein [Burkholderiales bacterium]